MKGKAAGAQKKHVWYGIFCSVKHKDWDLTQVTENACNATSRVLFVVLIYSAFNAKMYQDVTWWPWFGAWSHRVQTAGASLCLEFNASSWVVIVLLRSPVYTSASHLAQLSRMSLQRTISKGMNPVHINGGTNLNHSTIIDSWTFSNVKSCRWCCYMYWRPTSPSTVSILETLINITMFLCTTLSSSMMVYQGVVRYLWGGQSQQDE
jgi:hypothetical protein